MHFDTDITNYFIVGSDYSRESRIDRFYKQHIRYTLSKAFNGHCCKCNEGMGQLEFDHFWLPKSQGGNFAMRHKNGLYINNCIPLCKSCNLSKSAKNYLDFFSQDEVVRLLSINKQVESKLNHLFILLTVIFQPEP